MVRTQISLTEDEYLATKREAKRLGISLAELLRRSLRVWCRWMRAGLDALRGHGPVGDRVRASTSTTWSMARRFEAYVDTSRSSLSWTPRHAHSVFRRLFSSPPALVTTTLVVAEATPVSTALRPNPRAPILAMIEEMKPLVIAPVVRRSRLAQPISYVASPTRT